MRYQIYIKYQNTAEIYISFSLRIKYQNQVKSRQNYQRLSEIYISFSPRIKYQNQVKSSQNYHGQKRSRK